MVTKRRARPPLPDESQELGLDGAKIAPSWPEDEGSELEERGTEAAEVEADKSGDARPVRQAPAAAAPKPKETPERGKKPSPPPPEDVGAKDSGEASPVRDAPPDELATAAPPPRKKSKIKKTTKRVKRPPPPSQEERAQDEVDGSGDPPQHKDVGADGSGEVSLVRDAPPDELATAAPPPCKKSKKTKQVKRARPSQEEHAQDEVDDSSYPLLMSNASANEAAATSSRPCIVMSPDHNKRGAMSPTRAKRGATPLLEEEEQAEKHAVGTNEDGTTEPLAKTGMPADKANQKKKKKKLRKVSTKPAQPECAQLRLTGNRDEVSDALNASSPQEKGSAQEEEHQGEMVEQDHAGNTSLPQVKDGAQEKEHQGEEVADKEHADNTSPPQVNDGIFEEEHQRKDVVEQENANKTSFPQQKDGTHEDEHTGVEVSGEALLERNASSHKLRTSEGKKKPAVERSWSQDDELKILTSLVEHAQSHRGALPDLSDLLANLAFDKTDANADKLNDKIRKLESRYQRFSSRGCPTDDLGRRLFELSHTLWGEVDDDVRLEATHGTRNFEQLSGLYPYLAKEVKVYAETHSSGDLIMAAFTTIGDEQARHLDAMCKKQRVDAFNLDLSQAILTNAVLSALSIQIN